MRSKTRKTTAIIHCKADAEKIHHPVVSPIYQTTAFSFKDLDEARSAFSGEGKTDAYTRLSNPNYRVLEERLKIIHDGDAAQVFGSGMSAIDSLFFSVLRQKSHVIAHKVLYGCTYNLLKQYQNLA